MALWALTDNLAGAPKWLTPSYTFDGTTDVTAGTTDSITIVNHGIPQGERVTSTNGTGSYVTDGLYFVRVIDNDTVVLYDTKAHADDLGATTGKEDLTAAGTGHSVQVTPEDIFFIDSTEAQVQDNRDIGFNVPGWYRYSTGTRGGVARHDVELLCAVSTSGSVAGTVGDAGLTGTTAVEDATVADA